MDAILKFRHALNVTVKYPLRQLKDHVVAFPPWRKYFVRQLPPDSTTTMIGMTQKAGAKMGDIERQLLWIFRTLMEDGQGLFFYPPPAGG